MKLIAIIFSLFVTASPGSGYYDWPMWRFDHNRSASTPEQLADKLFLQWQVSYSAREPVWDDPLNQNLMQYDRIFEPVVAENKLFLGFNDQDKVLALDISSGKELWHFFTDGPVRLPLAYSKGKIFFTSDDGFLYCLNAGSGMLLWKKMLAPASNKLLGNKRFVSMWPARGGVVIKNDIIYTASSIFPLMGTFIYAINTADGEIVWKNEGTGSNYILQPHNSPAFAHVAPQGCFTISGDRLLVAGGRSVPAGFDAASGEELYYQLAPSGKTGGAFTCANDRVFFNHHRERLTAMYDSENGEKLIPVAGEYPVIEGDMIYFSGQDITCVILDESKKLDTLWSVDIPARTDLIKAGNCLYAADSSGIYALRTSGSEKPELLWNYPSDKVIDRLVASNGKLIAVANDGTIMVFGDKPAERITVYEKPAAALQKTSVKTRHLISSAGISEGYALLFGSDISLLSGLIKETALRMVVYEKEKQKVAALREHFDKLGIHADRLMFLEYEKPNPVLPKYFSSLTVINENFGFDNEFLDMIYESTRPYGGKILIRTGRAERENLERSFRSLGLYGAVMESERLFSVIVREGALEGSSAWTHNHGDIANTVKSDDKRVRAPLGLLWFGGNSNMDVLPRHGHGPGEQIVDGRLIIESLNGISARDVYTGRVLWKRDFRNLKDDIWLVYYDETYDEENPLDPKYNQVHLPGANSRGTNFIATKEYVYLIEGDTCHFVDIKTGELIKSFTTGDEDTKELGYIGVYDDLLILGKNFSEYTGLENDSIRIKNPKFTDYNLSASNELVVVNRFTGEKIWSIESNHGFIHNSVIAGDDILFCLDKLPQYLETKLKRRGESPPGGSRLLYVDIRSGRILNEVTEDVFGTWLGYSSEHKLLLQATRPSRDMLHGEEGNRMITYNTLTREKIWDKGLKYANPPIIHNDKIYTNGEGFHLLTGDPLLEKDPLTGEDLKWNFKREYGCGIVAASEHLLTFRSASAGFVNLDVFEGTGSLGGWKAGCSTNLIAADGVLNSPDYTRTCQCPYQNQTSLALVYMPWMTYWTNSNYTWDGRRIRQFGLNLNAPGDRTSENNTLWMEYPFVSGSDPGIPVTMDTVDYYRIRKEPISVVSRATPWISASALCGVRSLELTIANDDDTAESCYTVNLYFSELEDKQPGERVLNIRLQGDEVLQNFDIVSEAGKADKEIVKSFTGIKAGKSLRLDLIPVAGNTIISGLEMIEEKTAYKY